MTQDAEKFDQLWQAYMDRELSAAEAATFDSALTDDQRRAMDADRRLESLVAGKLADAPGCPDALWKRVQRDVANAHAAEARGQRVVRWRRVWAGVTAAAAALALCVVLLEPADQAAAQALLTVPADVDALQSQAEVPGDAAAVNQLLADNGVAMTVNPGAVNGHEVALLGARTHRANAEESVVEVMWTCCGRPVRMILAPSDSPAATALSQAGANGAVQATQRFGAHFAGLVGRHEAGGLLALLQPILPQSS